MLCEGIVVLTALYGAETWGLKETGGGGGGELNVFEMRHLRSMWTDIVE